MKLLEEDTCMSDSNCSLLHLLISRTISEPELKLTVVQIIIVQLKLGGLWTNYKGDACFAELVKTNGANEIFMITLDYKPIYRTASTYLKGPMDLDSF